jgi:hypothetical protein
VGWYTRASLDVQWTRGGVLEWSSVAVKAQSVSTAEEPYSGEAFSAALRLDGLGLSFSLERINLDGRDVCSCSGFRLGSVPLSSSANYSSLHVRLRHGVRLSTFGYGRVAENIYFAFALIVFEVDW